LSFVVGSVTLLALSAKRGVALTLFLSCAAAWVASRRLHLLSRKTMIALCAGLLAATLGVCVVAGIVAVPTSWPVLGRLAERASGQQASAASNVTLRELMWSYALTTTLNNDPLLGVGAYHPIEVELRNNNVANNLASGVHNSFIGYTFYAGFPEGFLVVGVFGFGVIRLWRVRRRSIYAPAVLGAVVSAIVTALTNVSFEVTYMGGPSWLVLGLAFGLSAKLMDMPDRDESIASLDTDLDDDVDSTTSRAKIVRTTTRSTLLAQ
jgi:O-antigen ligase